MWQLNTVACSKSFVENKSANKLIRPINSWEPVNAWMLVCKFYQFIEKLNQFILYWVGGLKEFDNVGTDSHMLKYIVYKSVKCVLSIFTLISISYLPITKRRLEGLKLEQ